MKKNQFMRKWAIIIGIVIILIAFIVTGVIWYKFNTHSNLETLDPDNAKIYSSMLMENLDPEADSDGDQLTNKEEEQFKTSPYSGDTDGDGLTDFLEVTNYKTNPLLLDTDEDGICDSDEIQFGLNALIKKSDSNTEDKDRNFDINYEKDDCSLNVTGNASIAGIYLEPFTTTGLVTSPGIVGKFYEIHTDGEFSSATISLKYTDQDLQSKSYLEDNLSIYQFTDDGKFLKVKSTIDKDKNTVVAQLEHFSKYVLGSTDILDSSIATNVMLVIDDSGSMYTTEYMNSKSTGIFTSDSPENDVDFKRVDMAKKLIEMSDSSISYGLSTFTADYKPLSKIGEDRNSITTKLNEIKTFKGQDFNGTGIGTAVSSAVGSFGDNSSSHRNFLVLLSDGESTENSSYSLQSAAIKLANEKNITIISIGLGQGIDSDYLKKYATETGGIYVYADNANALDDVYQKIINTINYGYQDLDGNGQVDSVLLADSGFKVGTNSLLYSNFSSLTGQKGEFAAEGNCFGISALTSGYYNGTLKSNMNDSKELKPSLFRDAGKALGYSLKYNSLIYKDNKIVLGKNFVDYKQYTLDTISTVKKLPLEDRYDLDGNTLLYSKEARELINQCKFLKINIKDYKKTMKLPSGDDRAYSKAEQVVIDISDVNVSSLTNQEKEAYEFFTMVARLHITQLEDDVMEKYDINSASFDDDIQIKNFNTMLDSLSSGKAVTLTGIGHAVVVTKVYRDINNPLEYKVYIYDSNDPTKETFVTIKKRKLKWYDGASNFNKDYELNCYDTNGIFVGTETDKPSSMSFYLAQ